jgi:hypothetical protein
VKFKFERERERASESRGFNWRWPWARDGVQDPSFFSPVQTGLPRELAESLTRATQPGLVSPGGSDQAQRYHPASLSSESGESLRHMDATLSSRPVSMVMRSPCAGDALDLRCDGIPVAVKVRRSPGGPVEKEHAKIRRACVWRC